jgi:hypothetical protein
MGRRSRPAAERPLVFAGWRTDIPALAADEPARGVCGDPVDVVCSG